MYVDPLCCFWYDLSVEDHPTLPQIVSDLGDFLIVSGMILQVSRVLLNPCWLMISWGMKNYPLY